MSAQDNPLDTIILPQGGSGFAPRPSGWADEVGPKIEGLEPGWVLVQVFAAGWNGTLYLGDFSASRATDAGALVDRTADAMRIWLDQLDRVDPGEVAA